MPTNQEKLKQLGWLDQDGICHFPDEVLGVTLGFKTRGLPGTFFAVSSPQQIQEAIDKGWIRFIDGDGNTMTFAEYCAAYSDFPDPVFQLQLRGTWPPKPRSIHVVGAR